MVTAWMSVNFDGYSSRVWRSVGCGRVSLAADSFEVGRLSSYRILWEEHVSLYGGWWRHSIVGAGKWRINYVYAEVPLWSASEPIARRRIDLVCLEAFWLQEWEWVLEDSHKRSCWKNPIGMSVPLPYRSDVYVCSKSFRLCLTVVCWLLQCNKVPLWNRTYEYVANRCQKWDSRWKKKTLQLIIGHFDELRNDMCAGQEERRWRTAWEEYKCRVSSGRSVRAGSWTRTKDRLVTDGWVQKKPWRVTIDAGAFVIVGRPDIVVDSASCKLARDGRSPS
jgi:hypothetical protein